jgi:tRNA-dihydrouridine synthase A
MSQHTRVYTEMVTTGALIHGDADRHLRFNEEEHPVALQLGGSSPRDLAISAKMGAEYGYDEINLNCGCPSDRVQNGAFGACLMREAELVRDCVSAMNDAVDIPVTVKHRLGIDEDNSYDIVRDFVGTVAQGGSAVFIAHARNAWLKGLSPKENREVPPLKYEWVHQLKRDFPHLTIVINGGITSLEECQTHLAHVDGVMLGRQPYQNPWLISDVDRVLFDGDGSRHTRLSIAEALIPYLQQVLSEGGKLNHVLRHVLGLYQRQPGGKQFRRILSEGMHSEGAGIELFEQAVVQTQAQIERRRA